MKRNRNLLLGALVLWLVLVWTLSLAGQNRRFRLDDEYGLWVETRGDTLVVHWITMQSDSGFLDVLQNGDLVAGFKTAFSQSHRVAFVPPNKNKPVVLQYGGQSNLNDQHETTIYPTIKRPRMKFSRVDSIYVLGDIHGEFERLVKLLQQGGLIDSTLRWTGGRRHLVVLGDIFDRGHNVTRTLWFLYGLEKQAERAGGRLHVVLGNHEIMTMVNDLRYLSGKENLIANMHQTDYANMFHPRRSVLGRWLASKPGLLMIDDVLFAHGGVHPVFSAFPVETFNDSLSAFVNDKGFEHLLEDSLAAAHYDSVSYMRRLYFFFAENSVFWYRGYVQTDTLQSELQQVLNRYNAAIHVVAHTPVPTITSLYGGKLIAVDLNVPASEMLLLVRRDKRKYDAYKLTLNGELKPL